MREELRTYTQLADEQLDALVGEMEAEIAGNAHAARSRLFDYPTKRAREYVEVVAAVRALISILRRVHPAVREGVGLLIPICSVAAKSPAQWPPRFEKTGRRAVPRREATGNAHWRGGPTT